MLGRWDKWLVDQVSDVPSIIFFHDFLQKMVSMYFFLFFFNLPTERLRVLSDLSEIMKIIMLGTSDGWSTSHLSQHPSKAAYYIVDCHQSCCLLPKNNPLHTAYRKNMAQCQNWFLIIMYHKSELVSSTVALFFFVCVSVAWLP